VSKRVSLLYRERRFRTRRTCADARVVDAAVLRGRLYEKQHNCTIDVTQEQCSQIYVHMNKGWTQNVRLNNVACIEQDSTHLVATGDQRTSPAEDD
jgi:hypothetical protein